MLLRPRWLAGHLLVLVLTTLFVTLGLWQLGREQEQRDEVDEARAAAGAPAPDLTTLEEPVASGTRVTVTGTYEPSPQFLLRGRSRDGESGYDIVTILALDDGTGVAVDRGWVARGEIERRGVPEPPTGIVVVRGPTAQSRALRPDDTVDERGPGRALALPRVDVNRIASVRPAGAAELRDLWVTAEWQDPDPGAGPALPEPQANDRVDHRSYAIQWFSFALIAVVGWPIILGRAVRRERRRDGAARAPASGAG